MSAKSNKNDRTIKRPSHPASEIKGLVFLLLALILGISLFTYYPGDHVYGINSADSSEVRNLFGMAGAHIAGYLFLIIGFSSFWPVIIFLSMAIASFRGRPTLPPLQGIIAGLCLILSFSGLMNLQIGNEVHFRDGIISSGGLAGYISVPLRNFLNYFGANVFLLAVFIISLMICTNISFGLFFSKLHTLFLIYFRALKERLNKRTEKKRKRKAREQYLEETPREKKAVRIIEPKKEPAKRPEQESFPFMQMTGDFKLPSLDLLDDPPAKEKWMEVQKESLEMNARILEHKLADFGVHGEVVEISPGPVITMYEYKPAPGIKISKVTALADDLTLALRAPSVRIIAPLPGKAAIGIEIANNKREHVYLKEVLSSKDYKDSGNKLTIALGKDITGAPVIADLVRMPHLLVAGATGTGKSVSLNAMINS
ncbi:MAG: DNA translocase FtsK 4TM domain-containing protein, partial [Deltaproteobacteria bacterium]|nr:DNA translocase FtsK 4TM domain-containing protein [Deltaproteobacteria bacterium]